MTSNGKRPREDSLTPFQDYPSPPGQDHPKHRREQINQAADLKLIQDTLEGTETAMQNAIESGNTKEVERLIFANPALLYIRKDQGQTYLHTAAMLDKTDIISLLINAGAELNPTDRTGSTPLHYAGMSTQLLIDRKADLEVKDCEGWTALHLAVQSNWIEKVRMLLAAGVDMNTTDAEGSTPLHDVVHEQDFEMAELLIKAGANIEIKNAKGQTPLLETVSQKDHKEKMVSFLLEHKANAGAVDRDGNTPLHLAMLHGARTSAHLLAHAGARIGVLNKAGKTPCSMALCAAKHDAFLLRNMRSSAEAVKVRSFPTKLI